MFLHELFYQIKCSLKTKELYIWIILFPAFLGIVFKAALYDIYNRQTKFETVPAAVVTVRDDPIFSQVTKGINESEDPMFSFTFFSADEEQKALELLDSEEVGGVIYLEDELSMKVKYDGMKATMLKTFIETYTFQETIIKDAVMKDPLGYQKVADALTEDISTVTEVPLIPEGTNTNYMTQYFYNLLAMVALFGSMTGLRKTVESQANLSALGARRSCSPVKKSVTTVAGLTANFIVQSLCMVFSVTFIRFVLKVDLGDKLPMIYLTAVISGLLGVCLGFLIGSAGTFSEDSKEGISTVVSLLMCFLSGLMAGDMRIKIEDRIPIINRINPSALISDCFFSLNMFSDYSRYITDIVSILIISFIFALIGFVLTRRRKYASL
ncbi:MAG: ABC transporter permease [Ruminococcus sp.]|nr:ABC transporter permease [Ruminococcus sp.]